MRKQVYAATIAVLLVLSVFSVLQWQIKPAQAATGTFGNTNIETQTGAISSTVIAGTGFTCPNTGTADSISIYIYVSGYVNVTPAIYYDKNTFLANTTTQTCHNTGYTWTTFMFASPPALIASHKYYLTCWANNSIYYGRNETSGTDGVYDAVSTYPTWPASLQSVTQTLLVSIYCTYTYTPSDATAPTYSAPHTNTTVIGQSCNFTVTLADETALANYTFGTNNTGSWINETKVDISGTSYMANTTMTLNDTLGLIVQWEYWFADAGNNLNNTGIQSFPTTEAYFTMSHEGTYYVGRNAAEAVIANTTDCASSTAIVVAAMATQDTLKFVAGQTFIIYTATILTKSIIVDATDATINSTLLVGGSYSGPFDIRVSSQAEPCTIRGGIWNGVSQEANPSDQQLLTRLGSDSYTPYYAVITGCVLRNMGIYLYRQQNTTISYCNISGTWTTGGLVIRLVGTDETKTGHAIITHCNFVLNGVCDAIFGQDQGGNHNNITYCEFSYAHAQSIYYDYISGCSGGGEIAYNYFYDPASVGAAACQIKVPAVLIHDNIFLNYDIRAGSYVLSLYSELAGYNASYGQVYNNNFTNCDYTVVIGHGSQGNDKTDFFKVYSNNFTNCKYAVCLNDWNVSSSMNNTKIYYNDFHDCLNPFYNGPSSGGVVIYNNNTVIAYNYLDDATTVPSWTNNMIYQNTYFPPNSMLTVSNAGDTSKVTTVGTWYYVAPRTSGAVSISITSPANTTYVVPTIGVQLSASGGTIDKIWWNCQNGTNWIYGSNQTYTGATSMTGFINSTAYTFYAFANNTDGTEGYATIMFSVQIPFQSAGGTTQIIINVWWSGWW